MCGRYTLALPQPELLEAFDVPDLSFDYRPRYNVAPGQDCPVVAEDRRGRRMGLMRWGFVPGWRDPADAGFVNARSESLAAKPSFREAFARRRCLVPADGFYEWARRGGKKVPFWFRPAGGGAVGLAGIWEGRTFCILTTEAGPDLMGVHPRMPSVIPADRQAGWLSRESDPAALLPLLATPPRGDVHWTRGLPPCEPARRRRCGVDRSGK